MKQSHLQQSANHLEKYNVIFHLTLTCPKEETTCRQIKKTKRRDKNHLQQPANHLEQYSVYIDSFKYCITHGAWGQYYAVSEYTATLARILDKKLLVVH